MALMVEDNLEVVLEVDMKVWDQNNMAVVLQVVAKLLWFLVEVCPQALYA